MAAPLTAERLRALLDYDPVTGVFRWRVSNGRRAVAGAVAGAISEKSATAYLRIAIEGRRYYAHHLAWLHVHGAWPAHRLDHISTDRMDNRIANLREATAAENPQNQRRAHSHNKAGLLGVSETPGGCYAASIKAGGKRRYLGRYATPEDAHAAYLKAKQEMHPFGTLDDVPAAGARLVKVSKTGFAGVEQRPSGKFAAYFNRGGRRVRLGLFATAQEAAEARKKAMMGD